MDRTAQARADRVPKSTAANVVLADPFAAAKSVEGDRLSVQGLRADRWADEALGGPAQALALRAMPPLEAVVPKDRQYQRNLDSGLARAVEVGTEEVRADGPAAPDEAPDAPAEAAAFRMMLSVAVPAEASVEVPVRALVSVQLTAQIPAVDPPAAVPASHG